MVLDTILLWLKATRAPFLTATIVSGIIGTACAWHDTGNFNWFYFVMSLMGIAFANIGTNLINDYFDHKSNLDEINHNFNKFSGGSRVIQDKLIKPKTIFVAGIIFFALTAFIGLYLNSQVKGNTLLMIGFLGIILGYFYTAEPLRFSYTPLLGEIVTGFCGGPLIVLGSYYVQTQNIEFKTLFVSLPIGLIVSLILFINEFPDHDADKSVDKKTLVVALGKKKAFYLYAFLLISVYLIVIAGVAKSIFPVYVQSTFITLPLAFKAIKVARAHYNEVEELLVANALTIKLHLIFGILFSASYLIR